MWGHDTVPAPCGSSALVLLLFGDHMAGERPGPGHPHPQASLQEWAERTRPQSLLWHTDGTRTPHTPTRCKPNFATRPQHNPHPHTHWCWV